MNKIILVFVLAIFASCTFTSTKSYEPKFKRGVEAIQPGIEALIDCRHINIAGISTTVDGSTERVLEISILNAADLPKETDSLRMIAKDIAMEFKSDLVNRGEFDLYKIMFVTQSNEQNVQSSYYEQVIFKDGELYPDRNK